VLRGAPPGFADVRLSPDSRSALEIVAHIADVLTWATLLADGRQGWKPQARESWEAETQRCFAELAKLDARLASEVPLACEPERLFQGPIADALAHIGQLALLRRPAGAPIRGENYFAAEIVAGTIGTEQAKARFEFD